MLDYQNIYVIINQGRSQDLPEGCVWDSFLPLFSAGPGVGGITPGKYFKIPRACR
jgi:hypothetical protein